MTINRSTLLDLPLPVTGTEDGTWGDVTNNGLTQYLDIAIAGMVSLTSSDFTAGALTIALTEGDSSATNIANDSAQYSAIKVSSLAQNSTITAPGSNRAYKVINADATYTLTIKASGQTGVTFAPGTTGIVAFNGTDYEILGVVGPASATDNAVPKFDGTTGQIIQGSGVTIDDSNNVSGVAQLNATTADLTNIEVTNIKAKDGTSAGSIADSTGVVTLASSVLTTTDINGGSIDAVTLGTNSAVTEAQIDNININGNTIVSSDTNGSLNLTPNGTGDLVLDGLKWPQADGTNGQALITNGSGQLSFSTVTSPPGGSDTQIQYNSSGSFAGASGLVTDGSNLTINAQGDLRFADSDSSNWVAFQGPATIASNVTWTLPDADGSSGQVLSTNGSGTLSWASGGTPGPFSDGTAGSPSITFSADTNTGFFRATTDQIGITTNGTERIRIDNVGNVGINDTTPTEGKLVVRSDSNSSNVGLFAVGGTLGTQFSNQIYGSQYANSNSTAYADQRSSLLVSNGNAEATNSEVANNALILVAGGGAATNKGDLMKAYQNGGNGFVFRMANNGNLTNLNNSYGSISDARLKQDIVDASSQWEDIKRIKVRKFRMIEDVQKAEENLSLGEASYQIGVIAQELEEVSPGLIEQAKLDDGSPDPESMKQVKYSVLYMKGIKALQEAMMRIEVLETKVAALEGNP